MYEGGLLVRFRIHGDTCPLAEATQSIDVRVDAWPELCRSDSYSMLQFNATGETEELAQRLDTDDRIRYLYVERCENHYTYRCLSRQPCIQQQLFDIGFMPKSITYQHGNEIYQGAVVGTNNLREMFDEAKEDVGVQLEGMQQITETEIERQTQQWDLTPSQTEAITTALRKGYFDIPRDANAADVASELGISQSAFLQRMRRAQERIFKQLFGAEANQN